MSRHRDFIALNKSKGEDYYSDEDDDYSPPDSPERGSPMKGNSSLMDFMVKGSKKNQKKPNSPAPTKAVKGTSPAPAKTTNTTPVKVSGFQTKKADSADEDLIKGLLPKVFDVIGEGTFSKDEVIASLRQANYDIDATVNLLLEKPKPATNNNNSTPVSVTATKGEDLASTKQTKAEDEEEDLWGSSDTDASSSGNQVATKITTTPSGPAFGAKSFRPAVNTGVAVGSTFRPQHPGGTASNTGPPSRFGAPAVNTGAPSRFGAPSTTTAPRTFRPLHSDAPKTTETKPEVKAASLEAAISVSKPNVVTPVVRPVVEQPPVLSTQPIQIAKPVSREPTISSPSKQITEQKVIISSLADILCSTSPPSTFAEDFLKDHPTLYPYSSDIVPFAFDTPSPDDIVIEARKRAFKLNKSETTEKTPEPAPAVSLTDSQSDTIDISRLQIVAPVSAPQTKAVKEESKPLSSSSDKIPKGHKQMNASRRKEIDAMMQSKPSEKEHINLIVIGHVDAGKSTLMGHLLYLLGHVSDKVMHKYEKESKLIGKGAFSYAWVLDEQEDERNRGITMDVGVTNFETDHRRVTLLDAPGHRDFVPKMISGATQADVAILVIDAIDFEAGFDNDGQTKEHAILAKSLGVQQLGVVINKLDMVNWSQERFDAIATKLGAFLKQSGFKNPWFTPISGLSGENLVKRSEPKLSWYTGPTLVQRIDEFNAAPREITKPFRFCVSDCYKGVVGGKIEAGIVTVGDKLLLMPLAEICNVKAIRHHNQSVEYAVAGDNVDITIVNTDTSRIGLGNILCDPEFPVQVGSKFKAQIITFTPERPILKGTTTEMFYQQLNEPAVVVELLGITDKVNGNITKKKPRALGNNTTALVEIKTQHSLCIEKFSDYKQLGRFTLRESGKTIAAGIIVEILDYR